MPSAPDIGLLDDVVAAGWRAPVVEELGGWELRYGFGLTGRANSARARRDDGTIALDDRIGRTEDFYRARELRPKLQLTPASEPVGLDEESAARAYERSSEVLIETARTAEVARRTERQDNPAVTILPSPDEDWLNVWLAVRGLPKETARQAVDVVAARPGRDTVFARVEAVAVGRAVTSGGWACVTAMATLPEARRRGAARAILHELARWALGARGAGGVCLPVETENESARALYEKAGFEPAYAYWYRTAAV